MKKQDFVNESLHEFANYKGMPLFAAIKHFDKYKKARTFKNFIKLAKQRKFQHPEGVKRILINKGYLE